jgi:hypothetical protein
MNGDSPARRDAESARYEPGLTRNTPQWVDLGAASRIL